MWKPNGSIDKTKVLPIPLNGFVFLLKSKCNWLAMAIEKDCLHNGTRFEPTSLIDIIISKIKIKVTLEIQNFALRNIWKIPQRSWEIPMETPIEYAELFNS